MALSCPRLVLAALRGGSGKTTMTLGLLAAWRQRGRDIVPFKKGPDYIDPAWHALAAGRPCYNLDPFLMERDQMIKSLALHTADADGALVEGNRGLYDGLDAAGTFSTAELAKLLQAPVVLVVDCTMTTRTAAALVLGCQKFDPQVNLAGVILNQIARPRHEAILRTTIEQYCGIPVLGALPRLKCSVFPERHMGLVPPQEHRAARAALTAAQDLAQKYLDAQRLWDLAKTAPPLPLPAAAAETVLTADSDLTIGIIRDESFQFYYPENLEALAHTGARLVELNALTDTAVPPLDALYIGGGFPETNAAALAANQPFRDSLRRAIDAGLPVYAECGGLMYLGRSLVVKEQHFPMVGALPLTFILEKRPQGHGYTVIRVDRDNPFFPVGTRLQGHEFHYSRVIESDLDPAHFAFAMERGHGALDNRDGICYKNVLATYTHLHALGTPQWAAGIIRRAQAFQAARQASPCHLSSLTAAKTSCSCS